MIGRSTIRSAFLASMAIACAVAVQAQTNIDPLAAGNQFGWSENAGWANLDGDVTNGVVVTMAGLSGYAWFENIGWVNFGSGSPPYAQTGPADFGVNHVGGGLLDGYAWGENVGWIDVNTTAQGGGPTAQVSINLATGRFDGHAWGENIGWVSFATVNAADVATVAIGTVPVELSAFMLE